MGIISDQKVNKKDVVSGDKSDTWTDKPSDFSINRNMGPVISYILDLPADREIRTDDEVHYAVKAYLMSECEVTDDIKALFNAWCAISLPPHDASRDSWSQYEFESAEHQKTALRDLEINRDLHMIRRDSPDLFFYQFKEQKKFRHHQLVKLLPEDVARRLGLVKPDWVRPILTIPYVDWTDTIKKGFPRPNSLSNVMDALRFYGISLKFNELDGRVYVHGFEGNDDWLHLDDAREIALWFYAQELGFHPSKEFFLTALGEIARKSPYHPIKAYLAELPPWDEQTKLADGLLTVYAGADDNPHIRELSELILAAAYMRVHEPGIKYDHVPVLIGDQGCGKSTMLRYLASDEFFTDCVPIGADPKLFIEQTEGVWIIEIPELDGLSLNAVTTVKAMVTRLRDEARLAYKRNKSRVERQSIMVATTNSKQFLRDQSGNRRFLPVSVGRVDLDGLKRDRDKIWAEVRDRIVPNYVGTGKTTRIVSGGCCLFCGRSRVQATALAN